MEKAKLDKAIEAYGEARRVWLEWRKRSAEPAASTADGLNALYRSEAARAATAGAAIDVAELILAEQGRSGFSPEEMHKGGRCMCGGAGQKGRCIYRSDDENDLLQVAKLRAAIATGDAGVLLSAHDALLAYFQQNLERTDPAP